MSTKEKINLSLQELLQGLHEDSYHVNHPRTGPIDLSVRFDTRFESSNRRDMQTIAIDIHIFNVGSPSRTFRLIEGIEELLTDAVLRDRDNRFIIKFPIRQLIQNQQNIDTGSQSLKRTDLSLTAKIYYNEPKDTQMNIIDI